VDECSGGVIEDAETLARIHALAVPPAWEEVWICPHPNGHIQAIGTDSRGRRQYRYHDRWRERRDAEKFEQMLEFARALPELRGVTARHLHRREPTRERVLAGAVRLLDRGFFRIGNEEYADENGTYGVATMERRHVTLRPGNRLVFDYTGKGGKQRLESIVDPHVYRLVEQLKRRRRGGEELLAYKERGRWVDVRSADINEYIKALVGREFTAKDFRTWSATVLAAVAVAVSDQAAGSRTGRKRAVSRAVQEVAFYLGNTPAVCRASYIDPRVFDRFDAGVTIAEALEAAGGVDLGEPALQGQIEAAVIALLGDGKAIRRRRAA
jgi:DNA topoisomerase-1